MIKEDLRESKASSVVSMSGGCPKGSTAQCGIMYRGY